MRDVPVSGSAGAPGEREVLEVQTRRNLEGMGLEQAGRSELAIELYEQNVAEGFEGDFPYGRLVASYERAGRWYEAIRVLERGIEVFKVSKRRTPADRRATLQAFRGRLRSVRKAARQAEKTAKERKAKAIPTHSGSASSGP